jgi:WD40 repeat protein
VLTRADYKLIVGSFALLAGLVVAVVLLMSTFSQAMAIRWLRAPAQRSRLEIRQYAAILARETGPERLDRMRLRPDGVPPLFAAMALAGEGEAGLARLRADVAAATGERRVAAMAGIEYQQPGSLAPLLSSAADPVRWGEAVQAAALADTYSSVDFVREMDGHFIALFPGKAAIPAEIMAGYQHGLAGLYWDADETNALGAARAFHDNALRVYPELHKPAVRQKIKDSWTAYLAQVFGQRHAVRRGQDAVRAAAASTTNLPPAVLDTVNRFLLGRCAGNPISLTPRESWRQASTPVGETLLRRHGAALRALAASADGTLWASGGFDNLVHVWQVGRECNADAAVLAGHTLGVLAVAVSPDGTRVASAGLDGTIRLWDTDTGRQALVVTAGTHRVSALAFSADGAALAVASAGGAIRVLDAAGGAEPVALRRYPAEETMLISVAASGKRTVKPHAAGDPLPAGCSNELVAIRRPLAESTALTSIPGGTRLAASSLDRTILVYDTAKPDTTPLVLDKHGDAVLALAAAPDGSWLASGGADRRVMLWSLREKKPKPRLLKAHKSAVTALAVAPDGRHLASAGADGLVAVWDAARGKLVAAHPTDATVNALCYEPDGGALLLACDDGTLRRWTVTRRDERPFSFRDFALWLMKKD